MGAVRKTTTNSELFSDALSLLINNDSDTGRQPKGKCKNQGISQTMKLL